MLFVLTSNPMDIKSIHGYNDNFILVLTEETTFVPLSTAEPCYRFSIYHQDSMDPGFEDYEDELTYRYEFIPSAAITQILDEIAARIIAAERQATETAEKAGEKVEEIILAVACGYDWTQSVVRYLNSALADADCETQALNLFRQLRLTRKEQLTDYVKMALNSNFVYPDDPIAFGYALTRVIGGLVR